MPVTVQLPGYNHAAPGLALAQVINAGLNARNSIQEHDVLEQKAQKEKLANTRAEQEYKQASDPTSSMSEISRHSALADIGYIAKSKIAQNPETQAGLARISDMIKNGVMEADPQTGQIGRRQLNALGINRLYTENPFMKDMLGQISGQQKVDAMAPLIQTKKDMVDIQKGRLEETRNQNAIAAGQKFEEDSIIKASKGSLNSLKRSVSILDNPDKPVTSKDLNLAYTDYINAVATGGAATEGKIARELPETFEQTWNEIKQKIGKNDNLDLRQTPGGAALIEMLRQNIHTVNKDLQEAIGVQAKNVASSFGQSSNQKVKATVQKKLEGYAAPEDEPAGKPPPNGLLSVIQDGHKFNWNAQTGKYE